MFERGVVGHITPSLHQPVVRVPLLIFEPGQNSRRDVFANTNAVDVLPTLLHLSDREIPDWIEGHVLPPYSDSNASSRSVFAIEAKSNRPYKPLKTASAMMINGEYKLNYYYGYKGLSDDGSLIEIFNIREDPEELHDLSNIYPSLKSSLLNELIDHLTTADEPYK
jgi:arylsulfatase A-like enzyme